jgi:Fe-S-cluster containining protein
VTVLSPAGELRPAGPSFRFACHPRVPCFNVCCRELDLVLTPYDVLRLKTRLGLKAGEFLDRHAFPAEEGRSRWPLLRLKMAEEGACPFVAEQGCTVYADRPSACRTYPLARATKKGPDGQVIEAFYLVEEEHCQGFDQDRTFTLAEWVADQDLTAYHHWNDRWMEILTHPQGPGQGGRAEANRRMFALASYNLDRFLEFTATERFRRSFGLTSQRLDHLAVNQEELLALALDFLLFSFFGQPTLHLQAN